MKQRLALRTLKVTHRLAFFLVWFLPPEDIWPYLETVLVVIIGSGVGAAAPQIGLAS